MQKLLPIAFTAFCFPFIVTAQTNKTIPARGKMLTDTFKGKVPARNNKYVTELILRHCQYCDDGTFILQETKIESIPGDKPVESLGEWTVLKGDAADENATVVEIHARNDTLYFLRMKNGDLQKLDRRLRQLMPDAKNMLRKSK